MEGSDSRDKNTGSVATDSVAASSSADGNDSIRITARSSIVDSFKGCGLSGMRIDKEDLKRRIMMPKYLRGAMSHAMQSKDVSVAADAFAPDPPPEAPEAPMVVFINSRSGGRHGPVLKSRLQELMGEEQVFDLKHVKPLDFVNYGLACLEKLADLGDVCAKESREKMRIMVAGGDGTVGWVLGSLSELHTLNRQPIPPTGIIPLGTGNDLSRSFGWGGSFPFAWRSAVKRSLFTAITGQICRLDSNNQVFQSLVLMMLSREGCTMKLSMTVSNCCFWPSSRRCNAQSSWQCVVKMPLGETVELPYSLRRVEDCSFDQDGDIEGDLPDKASCFEGVFYNYFSIGMDAQVAYGFHHLRDEKPYLAQGPIANKLIYSGYSCTQGWFFTPCVSDPSLRGLNNILRLHIKKVNCSEWEQIRIPSSVRALVALNLHSYGSGRHPWGNLKPEYLEKKGFVEAHADDGLLEIFGLKQGWHASFVMIELISAKHIAQAAAVRLEIRGGQWKHAYMQTDGEPWKQPINKDFSTFVEIKRMPFHSLVINGE